MNFYTVLATRPQYYDRNPLDVMNAYNAVTIAPAGATTRWTYTVPTSRKTYAEVGECRLTRDAVAGTPSRAFSAINFLPVGGATSTLIIAVVYTNVVGDQQNICVTSIGLFQAGDVLTGITRDDSTTGTFAFTINLKCTEFDA